jgi:hypothetical protein
MASSSSEADEKVLPESRVLTVHLEPVLLPRFSGYTDRIMMDVTSCHIAREKAKERTKSQQFEDDVAALMSKAEARMQSPPRRGLRPEEPSDYKIKKPIIYSHASDTVVQEPGYYTQQNQRPPNHQTHQAESDEPSLQKHSTVRSNNQHLQNSAQRKSIASERSKFRQFKAVGLS